MKCKAAVYAIVFLTGINILHANIISISADHILTGDRANNLFTNGSFETRSAGDPPITQIVCVSGTSGTRVGVCGTVPNYVIPGWIFTGDPGSYAAWGPFQGLGADGAADIYFGNFSPTSNETPSYGANGVATFPDVANLIFTWPPGKNIMNPTTLSQTIGGLIAGNTYLLDFYASGESNDRAPSVFGLSISGEPLVYLTTPSLNSLFNSRSERYHVTLTANANSETFEWINWGHICDTCTELVLDDVILNATVPEPSSFVLLGVALATLAGSSKHFGTR